MVMIPMNWVPLLLLAAATSSVDYDKQADFSRYKTWSWHTGVTPAMNPVTDKRVREAIEKGLGARGLSRVDSKASLLVAYHASRTTETGFGKARYPDPSFEKGTRPPFQKGSLVLDMLDADSGRVVWRGHATDAMSYGPNEIAAQVASAIEKLLASFPPPSPQP